MGTYVENFSCIFCANQCTPVTQRWQQLCLANLIASEVIGRFSVVLTIPYLCCALVNERKL